MRLRNSRFTRSWATVARISALPLVVLTLTGWIPNKDLELGPKGPWPWEVYIGLFYFIVGLVLLLRPPRIHDQLRRGELDNESSLEHSASRVYPECPPQQT